MRKDPDRVRANTSPDILRRIDQEIEARVRFFATQPKGLISARIAELEREWDIERYIQINSSSLALTGVALGATVSKKWLFLTAGVLGFLFQHATQGWCPPVPVMRRMGIRTRSEIEREKFALKALRGDFQTIQAPTDANQLARAQDALRAAAV
ncbi:MAG: DUF2892 domain-containing protein [Limisphaerales bacterium]